MKKIVILVGFILLVGIIVIFSQVPGKVTKDKTQSESPSEEEVYVSQAVQEDPYGKKEILGWLLRDSVFIDTLSVEIGLVENQKMKLAQVVKEEEDKLRSLRSMKLPGEEYNKRHEAILKATDDKIKQILSPIQYARFRDWIIEQWILDSNYWARIYDLPPIQTEPVTEHWVEFIRTRLNLSKDDIQAINQLIYQPKKEILPLRERLIELDANPHVSLSQIQKEGEQVVKQIHPMIRKMESDLIKKLPLNKLNLYKSYMEVLSKSESFDEKGGNR